VTAINVHDVWANEWIEEDEMTTIEADWWTLDHVVGELGLSDDLADEVLRARVDMHFPPRPDEDHYTIYAVNLPANEATRVASIIAEYEARWAADEK
jgi:hypothetical protein